MPRGFPFMEAEKNYIIGLVIKYKDAIENKKLDKDTIERKRSAWDKITKEYNANERHMPRNVEQLRKLWENIKCRRRSEAAKEKRNILNARYSSSSEMQSDLKICGMDIKLENASYCDPLQLTENNTNEQNTINDILDSEGIRSETGTSFVINLDSGEDEERSSELFSVPVDNRNTLENVVTKCNKCNSFDSETQLRIEKMKYSLKLEQELGEMRKEQERLKTELFQQQLETAINDEQFFKEKRELELLILRNKSKIREEEVFEEC